MRLKISSLKIASSSTQNTCCNVHVVLLHTISKINLEITLTYYNQNIITIHLNSAE